MKNITRICTLIAVVFLLLACGSSNEKSTEKNAGGDQLTNLSTAQQRRAQIKKDSAVIAEQRIKDLNARIVEALTYTDPTGAIVYNKAEVNPSFVGGDKAMMAYLKNNIVYPEQARKMSWKALFSWILLWE